jgi:hypothetical protein
MLGPSPTAGEGGGIDMEPHGQASTLLSNISAAGSAGLDAAQWAIYALISLLTSWNW